MPDIFISYAHVDNEPVFGECWVNTLVENLRYLLAKNLGRKDAFSDWRDTSSLQGNSSVTPEIHDAIKEARVFLMVLSTGYLESRWCQEEMSLFLKKLGNQANNQLFILEIDKLEQGRPDEITELLGYRFWYEETDSKRIRTLSIDSESNYRHEYIRMVENLAQDISKLLKTSSVQTEPKATVFLAEATDDMEFRREDVRRYLEQAGLRILPEKRLEGEDFKKTLNKDLADSKLFIQLLGPHPGRKPENIPQGYTRLQLEYAQGKKLPILHWRDPALDLTTVEAADQRQLLEAGTVYAEPLESFKERIVRQATETQPTTLSNQTLRSAPEVFINSEQRDRSLAKLLQDHLDERLLVTLPLETGKSREIREDLEDKLLSCDAMIVVYGETPVSWVDRQIRHCNKILRLRESDFRALAVYEGPPEEKHELPTRMPNLQIIACRQGLDKACLQKFIEPLLRSINT